MSWAKIIDICEGFFFFFFLEGHKWKNSLLTHLRFDLCVSCVNVTFEEEFMTTCPKEFIFLWVHSSSPWGPHLNICTSQDWVEFIALEAYHIIPLLSTFKNPFTIPFSYKICKHFFNYAWIYFYFFKSIWLYYFLIYWKVHPFFIYNIVFF
jgi:hypothetical protein